MFLKRSWRFSERLWHLKKTRAASEKKPAVFDYKARRLFFKARRVFFKGGGLFSRLLAGCFKTRIIRCIYRAETAADMMFSPFFKLYPHEKAPAQQPFLIISPDCCAR